MFPGGFLFQNHYPRFQKSTLRILQGLSPGPSFGGFGVMNLVRQFLRLKIIALHLGGFYMLEAAERELIGL